MKNDYIKIVDTTSGITRYFASLMYACKMINKEDEEADLKYWTLIKKDYPFKSGKFEFSMINIIRETKK